MYYDIDFLMDRTSHIDNVQSFVEVIGNNKLPWKLLIGRNVTHFVLGQGKVFSLSEDRSTISIEYSRNTIIYERALFLKEFRKVDPPLFFEQILELMVLASVLC